MKHFARYIFASMLILTACGGGEEEILPSPSPVPVPTPQPSPTPQPLPDGKEYPIVFSSVEAPTQDVSTRASFVPLKRSFVAYGYKNVGGSEQLVFNGYTVGYREGSANTSPDNTHGYYYVGGEQTIKYWDFAAAEYHFWGVSAISTDLYSFANGGKTLTIPNQTLRIGEPLPEDDILYSSLYVRQPVSGDVVRLEFQRPYARVRIQFYTDNAFDEKDKIELSKITFTPVATAGKVSSIYRQGTVTVSYPTAQESADCTKKESVSVELTGETQANLPFQDVTLTKGKGTASSNARTAPIDAADEDGPTLELGDMPDEELTRAASTRGYDANHGEVSPRKYYYYPLPMGDKNPAFRLEVSIDQDDELQSAVVPATYMSWKPNYSYTYIFKILEGGVIFVDAKVEEWQSGGEGSDEWTNW